jgi:hypothetical protein
MIEKAKGLAENLRPISEPHMVVDQILKDQGLMKEGETSIYSYFKNKAPHQ